MVPYLKINSHYYFLCCSGLKPKVFRRHDNYKPRLFCHPISSPVGMPAQHPYTIRALSNSRICGKPNKYTCHFRGKQKRLRVRFTSPWSLVCQQHIKLRGPGVARQMMWSGQICRSYVSSETPNSWKETRAHSEATAGTRCERKL